jgi:hypothetical protein
MLGLAQPKSLILGKSYQDPEFPLSFIDGILIERPGAVKGV